MNLKTLRAVPLNERKRWGYFTVHPGAPTLVMPIYWLKLMEVQDPDFGRRMKRARAQQSRTSPAEGSAA
jgi:hypothetical protein